jgi:hypothetical protein
MLTQMERHLAAILAADVVGFSRLMGLDEAGTLQSLKAPDSELVEPKISEYQGRNVKLTGDGVLAEFPSAYWTLSPVLLRYSGELPIEISKFPRHAPYFLGQPGC